MGATFFPLVIQFVRRVGRFRLRTVLVGICAFGLFLAWVASAIHGEQEREAVVALLRNRGAAVCYDYECGDPACIRITPAREPGGPKWLRALLGENFFARVVSVECDCEVPRSGQTRHSAYLAPDELKLLKDFLGLLNLRISGTGSTDDNLQIISSLKRLTSISLDGSFTDKTIGRVSGLKRLKSVTLASNNITDIGVTRLSSLPGLEFLDLSRTPCSGESLGALRGLRNLRELGVAHVTDAGMKSIGRLANLKSLTIQAPGSLTDVGLAHLSALKDLEELYLADASIDGTGLGLMGRLEHLKRIFLDCPNVTDKAMAAMSQFPHLTTLTLWRSSVTDAGIADLHLASTLEALDLMGSQISGWGLVSLGTLKHLRKLSLQQNWNLTDDALKNLSHFQQLEELDLSQTQIADKGLKYLGGVKSLRDLDLTATSITDVGLSYLQGLKNLEVVRLNNTRVTAAGIARLKRAIPKLGFGQHDSWVY